MGLLSRRDLGVVTVDHMVRQPPHGLCIAPRGDVLEGADADVTGGHARKDGTGQGGLAQHRLPRCHRVQRSGGWHSQRRHCLTDDVFAQHRTERGAPVRAPREGRSPGTLELDIAPQAVPAHDLAEQDRAPVAELRDKVAELVTGIGERDWRRTFGHAVPGQDLDALGAGAELPPDRAQGSRQGQHSSALGAAQLQALNRGGRIGAQASARSCCRMESGEACNQATRQMTSRIFLG